MQGAGERAGGMSVANGGSRDELLRQDLPALTGLRFVAAFSVLVGHGFAWILADHETPGGVVFWVSQISGFGMTLFFVLSGFVIHYNYGKLVTTKGLRGAGAFLWARFARLYPLFLLMMLVYVALSSRTLALLSGNPERFGSILQALPYFLLSIHTWIYSLIGENPVIDAIGGGSPITWSISTEWFFYFAYPLLAWLILRARTPRLAAALALLWSALWIAVTVGLHDWSDAIDAWAVRHYGPIAGTQEHFQTSFVRWLLYFSPYVRLGEFLLGTLVAQLYINLERRPTSNRENFVGTVVFFTAVISVAVITYLNYSAIAYLTNGPNSGANMACTNLVCKMNMNFALAPTAALLIFCGARYRNIGSRVLGLRPVLLLGGASYSIYLVHDVVLGIAVKLTGSAKHSIVYDSAKLVLLLVVVLAISLALYTFYEAPARKWLRGRRRGASVSSAVQATTSSGVSR
jgi:peptidoglycan/LPS O-acetylase OafA/YrhL